MRIIGFVYSLFLYAAIIGIGVRYYVVTFKRTSGWTRLWCLVGITAVLLLSELFIPLLGGYVVGSTLGSLVGAPVTIMVAFSIACAVAILVGLAIALVAQQVSYKLVRWLAA